MRNFILNIKFIRYHPIWWWIRLMHHFNFHFDDYHLYQSFWNSLNSGWNNIQYKHEFEKVWGKRSYPPERIVLSQTDFDSLQERLNAPPDPKVMERFREILNRPSPWDDE